MPLSSSNDSDEENSVREFFEMIMTLLTKPVAHEVLECSSPTLGVSAGSTDHLDEVVLAVPDVWSQLVVH